MVVAFATKYFKSTKKSLSFLNYPCLTIPQIKQIQAHLTISGAIADPYASAKLLAHSAISDLHHAAVLFSLLPNRSTFMWNTMIRANVEKNLPNEAILLYKNMGFNGFLPNNYTFSFVLRACVELGDGLLGVLCHCQSLKLGWAGYDFVQNGLIHMYALSGRVCEARKLFNSSSNRDVITWTAVINGYVKSREIEAARELFDKMPVKNEVTYSAMINGYAQVGLFKEGLDLFNDMQLKGIQPNHAGIVGALSACAFLGALDQGKWIHAYIDRNKLELDIVLGTALIDMYAKCGCMEAARRVFDDMPRRDVYAFTSLISGLANHGQSMDSFHLLTRMKKEGVEPNEVTFICILSACSRLGLVEEGLKLFESMRRVYGIEPGVEHYGCLVDLLGRAGMLEQAKNLVREMPKEPDSYVLGALLNACRIHGEVELGEEMVNGLVEKSLDHGGVHVLLSNIFASFDQWSYVEKVRKGMVEKKVRKVPGCSLIEINGVTYEFLAGDGSHELMDEIISILIAADNQLKSLWLNDIRTTELVSL